MSSYSRLLSPFAQISFNGLGSAGAVPVAGLKAGDLVVFAWEVTDEDSNPINAQVTALVEAVVSVDDELQWLHSAPNAAVFGALVYRAPA